ncbi:MAG: hypothetical protein II135_09010 [Clostridia bacterium]|nr:hypothetical protein [Clostridia bacterium]MBQ3869280.1 hypothetical protein [Clostridia bacterium]
MGLFDSIKNKAAEVAKSVTGSNKSVDIVFKTLPETLEEFKALPQAALESQFDTAAMTVLALCFYPHDKDLSLSMLEFLSGPREITPAEKQFIKDRFMDTDYIPRSYFKGSTPKNDYQPAEPYTITVKENPYSYQNDGYAKLLIESGGADSPRDVVLRKAKDGKWYLWEQHLLVGVRKPESSNPWA